MSCSTSPNRIAIAPPLRQVKRADGLKNKKPLTAKDWERPCSSRRAQIVLHDVSSMTAMPATTAHGHTSPSGGVVMEVEGDHDVNICRAGLPVNVDRYATVAQEVRVYPCASTFHHDASDVALTWFLRR